MSKRKLSLEELADKIERRSIKGNKDLLATAGLVRDLRIRIQSGEAGPNMNWVKWGTRRFGRGKTWLYDLNAIASAIDQKAALELFRRKRSERQKRYNGRFVELGPKDRPKCDPERSEVIKLIRKLKMDQVRMVHKFICEMGSR